MCPAGFDGHEVPGAGDVKAAPTSYATERAVMNFLAY